MNSAQSIAEALENLKLYGDVGLGKAWAKHFGVPENSPDLYLALTMIWLSMVELKDEINSAPIGERAKGLYLGAAQSLEAFVHPHLAAAHKTRQLSALQEKIDILHLAAEVLPKKLIPDLQPVTLELLTKELDEILQSTDASELEPAVKRLIRHSLSTLIMVLRNLGTLGPEGAARIFGSVAAELARAEHGTPASKRDDKSALRKALGIVKKVGASVIFAGAVIGGVHNMITDGSDIAGIITGEETPEVVANTK